MLSYKGRQIPETLDEVIDPAHTVFMVHEMLNDFCAEGGAFDKLGRRIDVSGILRPVMDLIEEARRQRVRIVYVRYTLHADHSTYSDAVVSKHWERISNPAHTPVVEGTWGWENLDELMPEPGDFIVRKYRPDAFFATPLDELLRWNGVRSVVIAGVGAEVGIVPTVMHASNLGYFSVVVGDCVRPTDPTRLDDAMRYIRDWAIVENHTAVLDAWHRRRCP